MPLPNTIFRCPMCLICLEDFRHQPPGLAPRVLQCGHRLCYECLTSQIDHIMRLRGRAGMSRAYDPIHDIIRICPVCGLNGPSMMASELEYQEGGAGGEWSLDDLFEVDSILMAPGAVMEEMEQGAIATAAAAVLAAAATDGARDDGVIGALHHLLAILNELHAKEGLPAHKREPISELKRLVEPLVARRHVLGVLGDTGTGKSTLLNALISEADMLPVRGEGDACTAVPIVLEYDASHADDYHMTLDIMSVGQWKQDLTATVAEMLARRDALNELAASGRGRALAPINPFTEASLEAIRRLFGAAARSLEQIDWNQHNAAMLADQIAGLVPTAPVSVQLLASSMRHDIAPITVPLQQLMDQRKWQGTMSQQNIKRMLDSSLIVGQQLEPVLRRITIKHKWPILSRGLVLMDLPGVADAERSRGNLALQALDHEANSVMTVARIERFRANNTAQQQLNSLWANNDTAGLGVEASYRTNVRFANMFVATRADDVPRAGRGRQLLAFRGDEHLDLFDAAEVDRQHYCSLCEEAEYEIAAMAADDVLQLRRMYARLRRVHVTRSIEAAAGPGDDGDALSQQQSVLRAFAVSAYEYLHMNDPGMGPVIFPSAMDTGIEALQQFIEYLPDESKKTAAYAAGQALLSVLDVMTAEGQAEGGGIVSGEEIQHNLAASLGTLRGDLDQMAWRHRIIQALNSGVAAAQDAALQTLEGQLAGNLRAYNTLQSVCSNRGRARGRSRVLDRNFDLNMELAQPITNCLVEVWAPVFGPRGELFRGTLQPWRESFLRAVEEATAGMDNTQVQELVAAHSTAALERLKDECAQHINGIAADVVQAVEISLALAYIQNARDRGQGLLARMQQRLRDAMRQAGSFETVRSVVMDRTERVAHDVRTHMAALCELVLRQVALAAEQQSANVGLDAATEEWVNIMQLRIQTEVLDTLQAAD